MKKALSSEEYDRQWRQLDDFIRYHPGARHRRRLCHQALRGLRPRSILDVGCGPGAMIAYLSTIYQHEFELWGVDLSSEVIEKNRRTYSYAHFETLDVQSSSLERKFDLVVCSEVIEHLDDRQSAFRNLRSMINPGGHLLITCPSGPVFPTERHFGHTSHPTHGELEKLAHANELTLINYLNWGFPLYFLLKVATNIRPQWALRNFASGDYTWTKKRISDLLYYANYFNFSQAGCQTVALFRCGFS